MHSPIPTPDAELSRAEVQAASEARFVLAHPEQYDIPTRSWISTLFEEQQAAVTRKAREHTNAALVAALANLDEPQAKANAHPGRAKIGGLI